jgi:hypothetical protein
MTNYRNLLQEHLQQLAPNRGFHPEQLYHIEEDRVGEQCFRARVVLINVGAGAITNHRQQFPWSGVYRVLMEAKQDASRRALESLLSTGEQPHDPTCSAVAISTSSGGSGGGGGRGEVGMSRQLPESADGLFPLGIVMDSRDTTSQSSPHFMTDGDSKSDSESNSDSDSMPLYPAEVAAAAASSSEAALECPNNLGRLGEEYAMKWLSHQGWTGSHGAADPEPVTFTWCNEEQEAGQAHDIEASVKPNHPGRRFIEVKTHWRTQKRKISPAQRNRLVDPEESFMILFISHFRNLFMDPPRNPTIQIFPNKQRATMKVDSECVKFLIGKKGSNRGPIQDSTHTRIDFRDEMSPVDATGSFQPSHTKVSHVSIEGIDVVGAQLKLESTIVFLNLDFPVGQSWRSVRAKLPANLNAHISKRVSGTVKIWKDSRRSDALCIRGTMLAAVKAKQELQRLFQSRGFQDSNIRSKRDRWGRFE